MGKTLFRDLPSGAALFQVRSSIPCPFPALGFCSLGCTPCSPKDIGGREGGVSAGRGGIFSLSWMCSPVASPTSTPGSGEP